MKKISLLALAIVIVFALAACRTPANILPTPSIPVVPTPTMAQASPRVSAVVTPGEVVPGTPEIAPGVTGGTTPGTTAGTTPGTTPGTSAGTTPGTSAGADNNAVVDAAKKLSNVSDAVSVTLDTRTIVALKMSSGQTMPSDAQKSLESAASGKTVRVSADSKVYDKVKAITNPPSKTEFDNIWDSIK